MSAHCTPLIKGQVTAGGSVVPVVEEDVAPAPPPDVLFAVALAELVPPLLLAPLPDAPVVSPPLVLLVLPPVPVVAAPVV